MPTVSRGAIVLAALVGLAAGDGLKDPADQVGARFALDAIDAYRSTVSKTFEKTGLVHCRYNPTCSVYGREAIRRYGLPKGGLMAAARIVRCNPFSRGGEDPVP